LPRPSQAAWPERVESEPPLRPLRLFERPEEIKVIADFPHGPPAQFNWRRAQHRITRVEGPERIAMEWWTQAPATNPIEHKQARTRDYFRIEDGEGCRFWLYREGIYNREGHDISLVHAGCVRMTVYAEIGVTTNFSFLCGASHPQEYVHKASRYGLYAIGIADHNTLAGVVRAYAELGTKAARLNTIRSC